MLGHSATVCPRPHPNTRLEPSIRHSLFRFPQALHAVIYAIMVITRYRIPTARLDQVGALITTIRSMSDKEETN